MAHRAVSAPLFPFLEVAMKPTQDDPYVTANLLLAEKAINHAISEALEDSERHAITHGRVTFVLGLLAGLLIGWAVFAC